MTTVGPLLRELGAALDAAGIPYMVVGSFASSTRGVPRTTMDLDLVIEPTATTLEVFLRSLDLDRYYVDADVARDALRRRSMFNVIDMTTAWKVDFVIRKDRAFSVSELARRTPCVIGDVEVPVASAEDTIVAKLEWAKAGGGSERQLADVEGIVRLHGASLDVAYVEALGQPTSASPPNGRAFSSACRRSRARHR